MKQGSFMGAKTGSNAMAPDLQAVGLGHHHLGSLGSLKA
jgi:hypothetical protein